MENAREPPQPGPRIGDRKGRKMQAVVTPARRIELAAERRICGLEQDLDIAAAEHGGDVASTARLRLAAERIGIDLDRDRRRRKAGAR